MHATVSELRFAFGMGGPSDVNISPGITAAKLAPDHFGIIATENGWNLYDHPERLAPGESVDRDVPHVTAATDLPYAIANAPLAGYTVRETLPVRSRWAATDRVYVLARTP